MNAVGERLAAALSDRYRIEGELGQGGMATVYLAADLKHDRKVAIKVLKPELAAVLGAERFVQEIRTTAALSHPHILPLFDSGEAGGLLYYVMPYIQGETVRDKLSRETLFGIEEALTITTEVADALDYAHRHGVIHRDIKPENILLHDGRPMVMDFGIALAVSAAAGGRMTETGLSLGTPHYMSPEQATADKELTSRSDIYSLGTVLYEMLTGSPPHTGATVQQIVMKIVTEEAQPVVALRRNVPANVAAALARSLEKVVADRFATAAEFRAALTNPGFRTGKADAARETPVARRLTREPVVLGLAGIAAALLVAVAVLATREPDAAAAGVARFSISLADEGGANEGNVLNGGLAVTEDGRRFAYLGLAGSGSQILLRESDQLDPTPIRATEDVRCCLTFSPDGQSLAYFTLRNGLKVVSLQGAISRMVADSGLQDPSVYGGGVDWGPDGLLYVSMLDGLWRLAPDGSSREQITTMGAGERTHGWPDVFPNGKGALLTVIPSATSDRGAYTIAVADFATKTVRVLFPGTFARYAASGHIVFVQNDGTLLAAPFDQDRLTVGTPVALAQGVEIGVLGAARLALSGNGTLVFRQGTRAVNSVTWLDRRGTILEAVAPELDGSMTSPRLSPDGSRFVVSRNRPEGQDLWTKTLDGGEPVRQTVTAALNNRPNWSRDGTRLYFISDHDSPAPAVHVARADGARTSQLVRLPDPRPMFDVLPVDDSTLIVRTDNQAPGAGDILLAHLGADTTLTPLVATPAGEYSPALSPDGRWLAYSSDESGGNEVYVRPFPNAAAGVFRVSRDGGTEPVWARSGDELFYRDAAGNMVSAQVATTPTFSVRRQEVLFSAVRYRSNAFTPGFDVSKDDRFLIINQIDPEVASELILVVNWFEELRRRVPR